ncbi:CPBP family intramembrane glutamic endopeptidase [Halomicronema hongdechloris]|uniref:CPBP family intramembrane glutamic endopeptidase n=1 Tax=Halomicronema hongdechloris TaxID=1209493 RepID=UPI00193106C4|nr:CPBP family intramembrane glutamic endopeptidase [Halomicronema hongdechloris]
MTPPPSPDQPPIDSLSRVQILAAIGITALILLLIARLWLWLDPISLLPLHLSLIDGLLGLGLGAAITLASALAYQLWPAYRRSADVYLQLVLSPLTAIDVLWLGILPGLSEELLFRGVMLPAIGLTGFGVVISSLCFGVLHLSSLEQWPYGIWATVIGLVLGMSALITGNLLVPLLAHIVTNLMSSLVWKLRQS